MAIRGNRPWFVPWPCVRRGDVRDLIGKVRCVALTRDAFFGAVVSALTAHSACVVQVMHMITHHDSGFRATDYARRLDPCTRAV
jgi:hypothetical protein